jgi:hypothetical protein
MRKYSLFLILVLGLFIFPPSVYSKLGVGVATGKIEVEDGLKPGIIYKLPSLDVINTGDEPSEYSVTVSYHEGQEELTPPLEWFNFNPSVFYLEPGENQSVDISLNLPLNVEPGDYFAYLEGYPTIKTQSGETSVGIAAATKLYFTVEPANLVQGVYYRLASMWKLYYPWPNILLFVSGLLIFIKITSRFVDISVNVKKNKREEKSDE